MVTYEVHQLNPKPNHVDLMLLNYIMSDRIKSRFQQKKTLIRTSYYNIFIYIFFKKNKKAQILVENFTNN